MPALITGATGLVGAQLCRHLESPHVLVRDPDRARTQLGDVVPFVWHADGSAPPPEAFAGVDCVFHLAGEPVAQRWSPAVKSRIRESRVQGTAGIIDGLERVDPAKRPRVLVAASAVGYYGGQTTDPVDEGAPPGDDFLAQVCVDWEQQACRAEALGIRVVLVRIGMVLGRGGGALGKMLPPFRLGFGGRLGDGKQWVSWIHLDDLIALLEYCAANAEIQGPINGVAPRPVTNNDLTRSLARAIHRPAVLPVPRFALRLLFGGAADAIMQSHRVLPGVAMEGGFEYRFGDLDAALRDLTAL